MATPDRPVPAGTKFAYGLGSIAYGIKDNGFSTFLLVYYNQVIGMPASQVGLAIMVALFLDAFIDPLVGQLSDQTRTRWGRRHPWLYASALPIAGFWLLLWHPPEASTGIQFAYLVATAILVRSAISCYEVPSVAIAPELSRDYHERTSILGIRYIFGWAGGLAMLTLAYVVLLRPSAEYPVGLLNRDGFETYAWIGAVAMVVAILVSALGTHRRIAANPILPREHMSIGRMMRAMWESLRNRGFAVLMAIGVCAYTLQGIAFSLTTYLYGYIWGFPQSYFLAFSLSLMAGVLIAYALARLLSRRYGKPGGAMRAVAAHAAIASSPYLLRAVDLFPANDSPLLLPVLMSFVIAGNACSVAGMIIGASMMADVVEDSESRTGRRSEGLFFAGSFFMQKCSSGLGIFATGMILAFAQFPVGAVPGQVAGATLDRLALTFAGAIVLLGFAAAWLYTRFPFGKAEHEARLAAFAADGRPD
ncbi:MAG: MFS transporter [Sphingomonadaceae bacterium]|nr:MFS transporter [Sphingomonadaceae bacterium]